MEPDKRDRMVGDIGWSSTNGYFGNSSHLSNDHIGPFWVTSFSTIQIGSIGDKSFQQIVLHRQICCYITNIFKRSLRTNQIIKQDRFVSQWKRIDSFLILIFDWNLSLYWYHNINITHASMSVAVCIIQYTIIFTVSILCGGPLLLPHIG